MNLELTRADSRQGKSKERARRVRFARQCCTWTTTKRTERHCQVPTNFVTQRRS